MADDHQATTVSDSSGTVLRQMIMGFRITQLIHVAATLGIADLLKQGPQSVERLAQSVGADAHALHRLLRALASIGIFAETTEGQFGLTPLAALLQEDTPGSLRGLAILYGEKWLWDVYGTLLYSVKTGRTGFPRIHGQTFFEYLGQHPESARSFNQAMSSYSGQEATAVLEAYDFSGMTKLVDVGGGHGGLLAAILKRYPAMSGVLFDLKPVLDGAPEELTQAGVMSRCDLVAGDFFVAVPQGGDAYLLKSVLHNWDDTQCVRILQNCRKVMQPGGRLLVVERVLPLGNEPSEAKLFDINMLVVLGGSERTEFEYASIFAQAGFKLTRVIATRSPLSIVEGVTQDSL